MMVPHPVVGIWLW